MRPRLVIATANAGKVAELRALFADRVELVDRPGAAGEIAETGATLEENALLKARAVAGIAGEAAVGDDTGLEVVALDGAPGVYSARFAGPAADDEANVSLLLDRLASADDRRARFRTVAAVCWPDGQRLVALGQVDGRIAPAPRGAGGFGYDPVFVPVEGDGRTFAEMTLAEKQAISHRGRAFRSLLAQFLPEGRE